MACRTGENFDFVKSRCDQALKSQGVEDNPGRGLSGAVRRGEIWETTEDGIGLFFKGRGDARLRPTDRAEFVC